MDHRFVTALKAVIANHGLRYGGSDVWMIRRIYSDMHFICVELDAEHFSGPLRYSYNTKDRSVSLRRE